MAAAACRAWVCSPFCWVAEWQLRLTVDSSCDVVGVHVVSRHGVGVVVAHFELALQLQEAEMVTFRESQNLRMSVKRSRPRRCPPGRPPTHAALRAIATCPSPSPPRGGLGKTVA